MIPKAIRQAAGLLPGTAVEVHLRDGRIEIEPVLVPVRLEQRGRWVVAVPEQDIPTLTAAIVEQTREALMRERAESM